MAVRPIDGNELVDTLKQVVSDYTSHGMYPSAFPVEYAIEIVEKMPTLTPPNEPLSIEQLLEMDGEPVWVEEVEHWALIDIEKSGQWAGIPFAVWAENGANFTYNIEGRELHCFRRPPEGEDA